MLVALEQLLLPLWGDAAVEQCDRLLADTS